MYNTCRDYPTENPLLPGASMRSATCKHAWLRFRKKPGAPKDGSRCPVAMAMASNMVNMVPQFEHM